jgi:hypothetical protein
MPAFQIYMFSSDLVSSAAEEVHGCHEVLMVQVVFSL